MTWTSSNPAVATVDANGKVHAVAAGTATITAQAGDKTATCVVTVTDAPTAIDLSTLTADYEAQDGDVLTGTLNGSTQPYKISIAAGATVTLADVTINGVDNESYNWAGITCAGDAIIILKGTNTVKGFYRNYPGILAAVGHTLIIKGTGSLTASSNGGGAGIGGGWGAIDCGNIEIQGGTITATGGYNAAGIGSGSCGNCGNISISGGNVTANGGEYAAGIGSGAGDNESSTDKCGDILISGGTVTATGGENAAGIGSGYKAGCGNIKITSGVTSVTPTKGANAPKNIGAGLDGSCGTVTIEGGGS